MHSFYYTNTLHLLCQKEQKIDYHDFRRYTQVPALKKVFDFGINVYEIVHYIGFICYFYVRKALNQNVLDYKALFLHHMAINRP